MIWYGVALHLFWAVMLFAVPSSAGTAPLAKLASYVGRVPLGLAFVAVACSACWALWFGVDRLHQLTGVMPQQVALLSSAGASIYTVYTGSPISHVGAGLLISSQAPLILAAVFHTVATYNLYQHAQ